MFSITSPLLLDDMGGGRWAVCSYRWRVSNLVYLRRESGQDGQTYPEDL
jgi:hypothetical protein